MARVLLENINKLYPNGFHAVHNVNIDIADKEFIILVGPSGCGKSTTLRMVAGLEEISTGDLLIDGRKVNDVHPKDRDIAMVFQNYALYPHMSVYENMAFSLKMKKTPKENIDKMVKEAAQILHIENLLERKPKQLSGGQRQRVALGRAIVRHPKAFLFDEPLSNLDAKLRVTMRAEISRLHRQLQATMIYVTHDQTEAMTMADRIVVMKDGFIHQIDSPMNLYKYPCNLFVAGFIGSPPMNFLNVNFSDSMIKSKGVNIRPTSQQIEKLGPYNGKDMIFGVRPEDITFSNSGDNAINAVVEVVETLGSEIMVHVSLESGNRMIIKSDPSQQYNINENVKLGVVIEKCHFFDAEEKRNSEGKAENICII
jgi:multiple sugar transport system ATP-binding protein